MDYATIRPRIKSGDLLAWSHIGLGSWHDFKIWMVRLFMRSEYSHVGTAWVIGQRVFVIEAVMPLVRIFPLSSLGDFYHLSMDAPWYPTTEALALSCVGHEYSQLQAIQAAFSKPPVDKLWECAELAASIALADGIYLGEVYTPGAVVLAAQTLGAPMVFVTNRELP